MRSNDRTADHVETPRDRLLTHGSHVLTDAELLAVLFRGGSGSGSALTLAQELLATRHGLSGFVGRPASDWIAENGVGPARSATLLAAVELARRIARSSMEGRELLSRPAAIARFLALRYTIADQEVMGALFLNTRNRLIAEDEIFRGTLNRTAIEPRQMLRRALLRSAAGIVLFHTHPSGDPSPSAEDLAFTRRFAEACDVVGVHLVDHLVLGSPTTWVSLRQRGGW